MEKNRPLLPDLGITEVVLSRRAPYLTGEVGGAGMEGKNSHTAGVLLCSYYDPVTVKYLLLMNSDERWGGIFSDFPGAWCRLVRSCLPMHTGADNA
jgi:hypothetical protein